jgi:RNA polymerase sigma factor (sigma-70 family)
MKVNKNMEDSVLLSLYKNGNEEAFAELLHRHKSKVYTTAYLIVKDRYIAEDLAQESWIKAVNKLNSGSYNEEGKFLPWIVRIVHNMAIDHVRKQKRYPTIVLEDGMNVFNSLAFSEDSTESVQIKGENHALLRDLIHSLPDTQREVLIMRHYAEMSFQEIAEATGVSINTALGRMRYALLNLRKKMGNHSNAYDNKLYQK